VRLRLEIQQWPLERPFRITGHTWNFVELLVVSLEKDGKVGRGEAAGVYYRNDTPASMSHAIESLRARIETRVSRNAVQNWLPPGGARNALDCALWDLQAKLSGHPVWKLAGLETLQPLLTTFTCGAAAPEEMAATARSYKSARAIKLKLTGEPIDADRVRAVRDARADVWLGVDANQGFTLASLDELMPTLTDMGVALIEQPFPIGEDEWLDDVQSPIPLAADESAQSVADVPRLAGRYDVVNIKLDKCGGLTEGLAMARAARALGLETMVGNMLGTSLAMAPGFLVGQLCSVVDLDGPIFLKADRPHAVRYADGSISCPEALWGHAAAELNRFEAIPAVGG
jgi:L-alanine-DL-glutamate epimerase-like enolase superfamily enzyme